MAGIAYSASAQVKRPEMNRLQQQRSTENEKDRTEALTRALALGLPVRRVLPNGNVVALRRFVGDRPLYYMEENLNAADTISTDEVWPGGTLGLSLDGSGETLGVWDSGNILDSHDELIGRVTNVDSAALSNHSTHVAGTMIGAGTLGTAKGMASTASIVGYDWVDDDVEMAAAQLLPNPIKVSNHSYGFISGWIFDLFGDNRWVWFGNVQVSTVEDGIFGFYVTEAATWDQIAQNSPNYLMVTSAGNDRNDGPTGNPLHWHFDSAVGFVSSTDTHPLDGGTTGYDTIGGGSGSAKNVLTVGAVSDIVGGYGNTTDVVMSSFSGWGPTDDGRIKPDIVANGIGLNSSVATGNSNYASFSGTSMSAPNVSGSLGLLSQHAKTLFGAPFKASTMKALIIHTADEAGAANGPDYAFGWGLMNTAVAADLLTAEANAVNTSYVIEDTLNNTTSLVYDFLSDGSMPFRATLAWTDPPGTPPAQSVDPPNLMLVNDIDIRVTDPNGATHTPWTLDPAAPAAPAANGDNFRDNVEQIHIETPVPGTYTVAITHKGVLQGGSPQAISLIVSGQTDNQAPVITSLTATPQSFADNATSQLAVVANDPDSGPAALSYSWSVPAGQGSVDAPTSATPIYIPPDVTAPLSVTVTVTVFDGADTTSQNIVLTVNDAVANQAPVITSLTATPQSFADDTTSQLAVVANDPDGGPTTLSYSWSVPAGQGSVDAPTSATPIYTPPDVTAPLSVTVTVTVFDGADTTSQNIVLTVNDAPNLAPVITSLTATPLSVADTATSQLAVAASDPDSGPAALSYSWTVPAGQGSVDNPASATPVYTPPDVTAPLNVTVTVMVSDGAATTSQNIVLTVNDSAVSAVAHWAFEEGTGVTASDASGNGNTGVLNGGASWAAGQVGGALSLSGAAQDVVVPDSASLRITGTGLTLAAWIFPTQASAGALIHKHEHYSLLRKADGSLTYADSATWSYATMGSYGSTPLNAWSHVAVTFDGTMVRFYINGVQVGAVTRTGSLTDNAKSLYLGGYAGRAYFFAGRLDEARVYDQALSAQEVAALHASGSVVAMAAASTP